MVFKALMLAFGSNMGLEKVVVPFTAETFVVKIATFAKPETVRFNLNTKTMNTKNILLGFFSLMTFASYAQTEKNGKAETKTTVTELKVETENLDELKNFDWNMVKEMFQENDAEQEITLAFAYVNKSNIDKSKIRVDNFKMKLTCQKTDLEKLTARLKKSFDEMVEINDQAIKN